MEINREELQFERAIYTSKLVLKYLQEELSDSEQKELDVWIEESESNRETFSALTNSANLNAGLQEFARYDVEAGRRKLFEKILTAKDQDSLGKESDGVGLIKSLFRQWMYFAAAVVVLGLTIALVIDFQNKPVISFPEENIVMIKVPDNHTYLTRSDGTIVRLDTVSIGTIMRDAGAKITKTDDGEITYEVGDSAPEEVVYNSITTPAGSTQRVVLPDGSRVWLNPQSRLEFPTTFINKVRNVSLRGEGYFDVAEDKSKPFHVTVDSIDIMVTGTVFNINNYKDENIVKSTVIEGGVRITKNEVSFLLAPGQQLQFNRATNNVNVEEKPDLEAATAWRNRMFYLDNSDVPSLMRQISRWYDISIEYAEGGPPKGNFYGEISKNISFDELLMVLNEAGIKTKLVGRTLVVYE